MRLEIALNLGILYFEVFGDTDKAIETGEDILNPVLDKIKSKPKPEELYPGSTYAQLESVVNLLKENLGLWRDEI